MVLDDTQAVLAGDPGGMLGLVASLGSQLREGFGRGRAAADLPSGSGVSAIVVAGMGGSGVAGDVLRSLYADRLPIPICVVKGYRLPEFCRRNTLVVASSFSGNTAETLAAFAEAASRGCRLVAITVGGELGVAAAGEDAALVRVPDDVSVPRAALGYLVGAVLGVLDAMGLLPPATGDVDRAGAVLDELGRSLGADRGSSENEAKALASWLLGRTPVVWGTEGLAEAAAIRWKSQCNENAKVPALAGILPELDHNDIEGWSPGSGSGFGLVVLRHQGEDPRVARRVGATLEAIEAAGLESREVGARGDTPIERVLSLIMVGDFVTTYLGVARGVDPTPIPILTGLKERLRR
jgi:glucose/mannose-6-phosphate isomerase